jgi:L-tartrate/succinate antiporter
VSQWAASRLEKLGRLTTPEYILAAIVVVALFLWVVGSAFISAATVALVAVSLMLITRVVTWADIVADKRAWTTFAWLGALIALCDGLNRVGFIKWFADGIASHMKGFSPLLAMVVLLVVFFVAHYLFASLDAYTTALLPVILVTGISIPGIPGGSLRRSRTQQARFMPIAVSCRLGTTGGSVRFSEQSSLSCFSPSGCLGHPSCGEVTFSNNGVQLS